MATDRHLIENDPSQQSVVENQKDTQGLEDASSVQNNNKSALAQIIDEEGAAPELDGTQGKILRMIKEKLEEELDKERSEGRYIIDSRDNIYLNYFEYVVMSLAVWNALWTPLTISFQTAKDMSSQTEFQVIDICVDTVFWIDLFL